MANQLSPTIAVIIPIYNVQQYLQDCLDSLLCQTYQQWVAYCVDDGSTDNSGAILDEYAKRDSRILAFHKINGGEHSARNYALEKIPFDISTWIAFLDSDDYLSPIMFEHLSEVAKSLQGTECSYMRLYCQRTPESRADNIVYQAEMCDFERNINDHSLKYRVVSNDEYFFGCDVGGQISSACINSMHIMKYGYKGPEEMRMLGDQVFSMKYAIKSKHIAIVENKDYYYRTNPYSIVHTIRDSSKYIILCLNYVFEAMKEDGINEARRYFLDTSYIPGKIRMLLSVRYRCGKKSDKLPDITSDIIPKKYIHGIKYKLLYLLLKISRRIDF